ncbi:disulfide bond formation protein B [Massilia sp. YIM B02443]|uniref:disulfide bond formation protein B n=1 Tax=Massilia sp. YIM B02443 TaxID=3050127 RepID=UPI0025B646BB|nr:disulfide bond formation protein B [Massilia sp. YIM B02443]MDN4037196.1 disulfide bond formation protein B [Massilia sp. YIM B02443]
MLPTNRQVLYAISSICFALIGVALYLQHALEMQPCPLCVIQRYMFLAIGVASLVGAISGKVRVWTLVALLGAVGGLYTVGKHLYVIANPGFSCGIDPMETFLNKIPSAEYLPWLFRADGLCTGAVDKVLGLAIPQWSAVWFVVLTVLLAWVLVRQRRAGKTRQGGATA